MNVVHPILLSCVGESAHLQFSRLPLEHHVKAGEIGQVPLVAKGGYNHIPHLVKTAAPRTPAHLHGAVPGEESV